MKTILYTLIILFLTGCVASKKQIDNSKELSNDTINILYNDTVIMTSPYIVSRDVIEVSDNLRNNNLEISVSKGNKSNLKPKNNNLDSFNIIDKIDYKNLNNKTGIIAYNVPANFKVNEWSTIKLRITRDNDVKSIVVGDRDIPIVLKDSDDKIILESIKVDEYITASLYSDDADIKLINNKNQRLYDNGYTEWIWRIKPNKSNNCYLKMTITLSERDLVVYEKEIPVSSNWLWSFSNWVAKWWQAITATVITPILIPFFIWLRNRKKSKDKDS